MHILNCRRHNPPLVLPLIIRANGRICCQQGHRTVGGIQGSEGAVPVIFAGGLLALFVVFVIMYIAGISQWICIGFGVTAASALVWLTFHLNAKYGEHGLMKLSAVKYHPRYIINRLRLKRLIKGGKK